MNFKVTIQKKDIYISGKLSTAQEQFWESSLPFYVNLTKNLPYESLGYSSAKTYIYYNENNANNEKLICCYDSSKDVVPTFPDELEHFRKMLQNNGYVLYHFQK